MNLYLYVVDRLHIPWCLLQVMRIRRLCGTKGIPVPRIGFVEDFINDEKAVILISCVESYPAWAKSSYDIPGFISSPEMSNTAVSRAREHLVVFGNPNTLGKVNSVFSYEKGY